MFATGKITCASFVFNNLFEFDGATGIPRGFFVDVMDEASKRLDLNADYKEIGSFATGFEELKSGRFDMLCASLGSFVSNYGKMLFSTALFYDPIYVYGDAKRDYSAIKSAQDLNKPVWRIAGMEGELGGVFGPIIFPKATLHVVNQTAGASALFLDMFTNKADVVLLTAAAAKAFEASQPGKIKRVTSLPVTAYPIRFVFKPDDMRLKITFDMVLEDMRADGTIKTLMAKYGFVSLP